MEPGRLKILSTDADAAPTVCPHQCFCEQLCPVFRGKLERFRLLASAFAKCEVELGPLTLSDRANTTDVSIRPLEADSTTEEKGLKQAI